MQSEEYNKLLLRIEKLKTQVNTLSAEVVIFREKLSRLVIQDNRKK